MCRLTALGSKKIFVEKFSTGVDRGTSPSHRLKMFSVKYTKIGAAIEFKFYRRIALDRSERPMKKWGTALLMESLTKNFTSTKM